MENWVDIVITAVITSTVTYVATIMINRLIASKKQKQLRYDEFFAPFFQYLYTHLSFSREFCDLSIGERNEIVELISKNLKHLNDDSLRLFFHIQNYNKYLNQVDENDDFIKRHSTNVNDYFDSFIRIASKETRHLCNILKINNIASSYELHLKYKDKDKKSQEQE